MAHDKYTRRQKYISTDGGLTFNPVTPPEYIKGEPIETDSVDCGAEVITWVPVEDVYICENVAGSTCTSPNNIYYYYPDGTYHRQSITYTAHDIPLNIENIKTGWTVQDA